jgi:hypothetical protein
MSIKSELNNLKNVDVYSLLLFTLYQCRNSNEYSALSELAYILDEQNLLNLCEYFGGMTITIPKIEELELLLCGLSVYKSINIDGMSVAEGLLPYQHHKFGVDEIKEAYLKISNVMTNYHFGGTDEI